MKSKIYRIGILMAERSNPFWWELHGHFNRLAPAMGFEVNAFWPPPEGGGAGQCKEFVRILKLGFDLIVINPLTRKNLVAGILRAHNLGIPVLDVGAKTDSEFVRTAAPVYCPVRTVDFFKQGVLGGEYTIRKLEPGHTHNVVILEGRPEATQSLGRCKGAADTFGGVPAIRLIRRERADFGRRKAKAAAARILAEGPEVSAFFCANDLMALGVADACHRRKRGKRPIIVGVDLIPETRQAIREGLMDASVAFSTASVARSVLGSASRVLQGKTVSGDYLVNSSLVDQTNLDEWEIQEAGNAEK